MITPLRNFFLLLSMGVMALAQAQLAHAARHALLIGNDSYQEVPALRNARADADAMAVALQKAGYTVMVVKDRNLKQMKDDVRDFKALIKGGDEVVLFYSGHGVQIEAMNYLLPVDVRADSEDQVRDDALALSRVLEDLREQKPALTLAVVDACRDNPFKGTGRAIGGRGLTGVGGANGQMVIYSAGEGQQALDSLSEQDPVKNGLFTRVFMKEMERPGVPIDQVARQVRAEVNRMALTVKHEQVPAIYDQVIGQFYFYAQNDASVDEVEILFWKSVEDSRDASELGAYLDKYPDGQFAGLAQARIKRIEQGQGTVENKPVAEIATPVIKEETPVAELPVALPTAKDVANDVDAVEMEVPATVDQITAPVMEANPPVMDATATPEPEAAPEAKPEESQPLPAPTVDSSAVLSEITTDARKKTVEAAPAEAPQATAVPVSVQ